MRLRALLFMPALAVTVAGGLGAGGAPAAGLYTTSTHAATVSVGTAFSASATTAIGLFSGTTQVNSCNNSTLGLVLRRNSGGKVVGAVTSGTFTNCVNATTANFSTPWTVTIAGSGVANGATSVWPTTTVDSVSVTFLGGTYTGTLTDAFGGVPPANGVSAQQSSSAGAPVCLVFANAGTLVGPLTSSGHVDGTYCLEGTTASQYSLGN